MTKEQNVTLPLDDIIYLALGDDKDGISCLQIKPHIAIVLNHHLQGSLRWKIEFNDRHGEPLDMPMLWKYSAWKEDSDLWFRQKDYADKERVKRWIANKNIDNLSRAIERTQSMTPDFAKRLAFSLLKQNAPMEVLKIMGISKLITKEEEL